MPNNKNNIYIVLIMCIAIVVSVWLFQRIPQTKTESKSAPTVEVSNFRNIATSTGDWSKILTNISGKESVIDLTQKNNPPQDTTLTDQFAKDVLSQYLLAKQGGKTLTQSDIDSITKNTLDISKYTSLGVPIYKALNLHVLENTSQDTMKSYQKSLNLVLKNRSESIKDNPVDVIKSAMSSNNSKNLAKLDPTIATLKGMVTDLLDIQVPRNVISLHLDILNSFSGILSSLESLRAINDDPVRSLSAVSGYQKNMVKLSQSLQSMNSFLDKSTR